MESHSTGSDDEDCDQLQPADSSVAPAAAPSSATAPAADSAVGAGAECNALTGIMGKKRAGDSGAQPATKRPRMSRADAAAVKEANEAAAAAGDVVFEGSVAAGAEGYCKGVNACEGDIGPAPVKEEHFAQVPQPSNKMPMQCCGRSWRSGRRVPLTTSRTCPARRCRR